MQHLALVAIVVPDYDAGIAFYVDKLGFELIEDTDLGHGKRWVRIGPKGAQTAFLLARAVDPTQLAVVGNQGGGRVWLFLHTDDFDQDHSQMVASGVAFEEEPRTEPYGKVAVFQDPFGNRWDLLSLNDDPKQLAN